MRSPFACPLVAVPVLVLACNQDQAGVVPVDDSVVPVLPGKNPAAPAATEGTLFQSEPTPGATEAPTQGPPTSPTACTADADCTGGTVCAASLCLAPCSSDADCAAAGLVCDEGITRCAECVTDNDCTGGMVCVDRACSAAADDTSEPMPVAPEPAMTPEPAPSDDDMAADDDMPEPAAPADDDTATTPEPTAEPTVDANGCTLATVDPCTEGIPMMTGEQTVDGDPSDFCDVPQVVLDLSTAALSIGDTSGLPHRAEIRVAWTADALHLYAKVTDPNVMPEAPPDSWSGDSLDVYLASSSDTSGNLGDDGTPQLILAPPSPDGSVPASAMRFPAQEQISSGYAAMTTDDGYVVELSYPWPGGATMSSGSTIAIDFALNVREMACGDVSDLNDCRQYYGAYTSTAQGSGPCDSYTLLSGQSAEPWCDNRTWCPATLQ